jgi:hypothetical protein
MTARLSNEGLLLGVIPLAEDPLPHASPGRILWNISFHMELETMHGGYAEKTLHQEHRETGEGKRIEAESKCPR